MIPRRVHQIYFNWGTPLLERPDFIQNSEGVVEWAESGGYEYRLWDAPAAREVIAEHFPELLDYYDTVKFPVQQTDLARYAILFAFGGFYVDMDMTQLKSLNTLCDNPAISLLLHNVRDVQPKFALVENDLMASSPRNPFWKAVLSHSPIDYAEKERIPIYQDWHGRFVLHTTGPYFLSRFVQKNMPDFRPLNHFVHTKWHGEDREGFYFHDDKANSWATEKTKRLAKKRARKRATKK